MKKLPLLLGLLNLEAIEMHKIALSKNPPHARFTEEQLNKIEAGLAATDTSALTEKIKTLETDLAAAQTENTAIEEELNTALGLNELSLESTASTLDKIKLLGTTCKEYGDAKPKHTTPRTDGKDEFESLDGGEKLVDGYFDPEAPHNKNL